MGIPFAHGSQKRWIVEALWRLSLFKFDDNPGQVPFAKHAGPFQWPAWLYSVSKNQSCQGLPKTSQKLQSFRHLVCSNIFSHLLGCPTPHIGSYDDASPLHASTFDQSHWIMGPLYDESLCNDWSHFYVMFF
jgi:hypothetical protein